MTKDTTHFEKVTLLITHYNRSSSLEKLLASFANAGVSFKEIVVADDASKAEHVDYIKGLQSKYDFTLSSPQKNGGLGSNLNRGQDAVETEYTLYVQEDFTLLDGGITPLINGLNLMEENKAIDSVRFYAYGPYPNLRPYKNGFSEMVFSPWSLNSAKTTMYSDHPHLRRSNFFEKFGRYNEIRKSDKTEYDMMMSFLKNSDKALLFDNYKSVFEQANSDFEPSTVKRNPWRYSNAFFISIPRYIYRILKFNYIYFLKK
jgi:glycosyltransferase involved in cell wall biosynthesis